MKAIVFLCALLSLVVITQCQVDLNEIFVVSVRGSFEPDISGFECTACDCIPGVDVDCNSQWLIADCGEGDEDQQRWGNPPDPNDPNCACFCQSGIGFQGATLIEMQANSPNSTQIGRMTHYNNVINPPSPTKLQLFINLTGDKLPEGFQNVFPLSFYETTNQDTLAECDPSIQRFDVPCDDRFSFDAYVITRSFLRNNVRYTLQITGFIQEGGTEPIAQFVTKEREATTANVFAKIVTFCESVECPVNYQFEAAPICACVCALTNKTCTSVFGPDIIVNNTDCTCGCALDGSQCNATDPDIGAWNPETCSCGCNVTRAYCASLNPLFEPSLLPDTCECACNRQRFIECRTENSFFIPLGEECLCQCVISNDLCQEIFGDQYRANKDKCACFIPGEDTGLTDAEIAGIVVASVVGPLLIIAFILLVAAILAYLILAGYIPGIYGYKIAQGSFAAGGISGLYADKWTNNSNAAAG